MDLSRISCGKVGTCTDLTKRGWLIRFLASERLADAEATASSDLRRAQREPHAYHSSIYPPGSEFALCQAQSQIMNAVVGVLNENLVESIKGFYKIRKAYMTLEGIMEAERNYMRTGNKSSALGTRKSSYNSLMSERSKDSLQGIPGAFDNTPRSTVPQSAPLQRLKDFGDENGVNHIETADTASDDGDTDEFYDADEVHPDTKTPETYQEFGHVEIHGVTKSSEPTTITQYNSPTDLQFKSPTSVTSSTKRHKDMLDHDPDSNVFSNPIDIFVHSGTTLSFGLILLLISLVPPAFGKLLSIIGFRGDRERGIRMLWQATKFHNINGAMAGLMMLAYYTGIVGYCDIVPEAVASGSDPLENLDGHPTHRLEALLAEMRSRYPKSHLWLLEEARAQASQRHLDQAIATLSGDKKSPLKQVEALSVFEKSLNAIFSHRYMLCSDSFLECVQLNNWSHALYYYIAGSAHVELYRRAKEAKDNATAEQHANIANDLLQKVRPNAGKKKFMARQLPFDIFIVRKLNKWEARAKGWSVPLIDAIGVSPLEEMIYFWNGYKRMDVAQLEHSLDALAWSEDPARNPNWFHEGLDEHAILAVLRAATLRNLERYDEAKALLKREVLSHDKALFKGHLKDDWMCPTAHYEMAANLWLGRQEVGEKQAVKEALEWLEKTAKWEGYELDTRIGLKVTTGLDTLRKWKAVHDS